MYSDLKATRTNKRTTFVLLCAALLAGICLASPAKAQSACSFTNGTTTSHTTLILPATITVPVNTVVGTILHDSGWVPSSTTSSIQCGAGATYSNAYGTVMTLVPGQIGIYQTGVPGIGLRSYWLNGMGSGGGATLNWPVTNFALGPYAYGPMGQWRVQLLVTGPVSAGMTTTIPTPFGEVIYGGATVARLGVVNTEIKVVAPSCAVQDSSIVVPMPPVPASRLLDPDATAGDTSFSIPLHCAAPVNVHMTVTDATDLSNTGTSLSLTAASTAHGVAYQITHKSMLVAYGPDSATAGNLHQFHVATVSSPGVINIPFSARYLRTGAVQAGSAHARATFTMSYQ